MSTSFPSNLPHPMALAAIGALFLVGVVNDLRTLENEFGYQHRLMACIGMYAVKLNLSAENPRTICERAAALQVTAELD